MAPLTDNGTSLTNNVVYTNYVPKFIIGLSIIYILSLLARCVMRKYRRFRDKKQQQEIRRLKLTWNENIKKQQLKDSILFEQQEKHIDTPPTSYNESYHSSSSSTLHSPTIPYNHSTISFSQSRSLSTNSSFSAASSNTIDMSIQYDHSNKKDMVINVLQDLQQKKIDSRSRCHWKINNNKRLSVLWQWSVSKGYLEYQHAKNLNLLIDELSRNKSYNAAGRMDKEVQVVVGGAVNPVNEKSTCTECRS